MVEFVSGIDVVRRACGKDVRPRADFLIRRNHSQNRLWHIPFVDAEENDYEFPVNATIQQVKKCKIKATTW
jgi:hypothetical protein